MSYIKTCPKCGSTDVKMPHAGLDVKMTMRDECLNCGFIGNFPEVEEKLVKKFKGAKKCS